MKILLSQICLKNAIEFIQPPTGLVLTRGHFNEKPYTRIEIHA